MAEKETRTPCRETAMTERAGEAAFETVIEEQLLAHGYVGGRWRVYARGRVG